MTFDVNYNCNKCKAIQSVIVKSNGGFYCPSCDGIIMTKFNVYVENIPICNAGEQPRRSEIIKTNKTSWSPCTGIKQVRDAIKKNEFKFS